MGEVVAEWAKIYVFIIYSLLQQIYPNLSIALRPDKSKDYPQRLLSVKIKFRCQTGTNGGLFVERDKIGQSSEINLPWHRRCGVAGNSLFTKH